MEHCRTELIFFCKTSAPVYSLQELVEKKSPFFHSFFEKSLWVRGLCLTPRILNSGCPPPA
jgi:hypothetical protein